MKQFETEGDVRIGITHNVASVRLLAGASGHIIIGRRCNLKAGVVINCYGGVVTLGDRVSVGEYTVIYGHGSVTIDDAVAIGHTALFLLRST